MIWHSESLENILKELDVSRTGGLTAAQAEARTERYGANLPPKQQVHRLWSCIKSAFHNPGIGVMLAVAVGIAAVSVYRSTKGYPTDWTMAAVLTGVAVVYVAIAALIRYASEKRLAKACTAASCKAKVLREGTWYATTADRLVRVMHKEAGVPLTDCIKMICRTPARVMGLTDRGALEIGYRADLVLFDENIEIKKVIIEGKEI